MDAKHLKAWRKSLNMSQKDAAEALGLKRRIFQYYEKGERDGDAVKPPKTVRLACWALTQGVVDYLGPDLQPEDKKKPKATKKPSKSAKLDDAPREQAAPVVVALVSPPEDLGGTAPVPAVIPVEPPARPRAPKSAAAARPPARKRAAATKTKPAAE